MSRVKQPQYEMERAVQVASICVDEAGLGNLAGDLAAAAVYVEAGWRPWFEVRDSKRIKGGDRIAQLSGLVHHTLPTAVVAISAPEFDRLGPHEADRTALARAVRALGQQLAEQGIDWQRLPIFVDGDRVQDLSRFGISCFPVPHGDAQLLGCAAASIASKHRHNQSWLGVMLEYPEFARLGARCSGYATAAHRRLIAQLGWVTRHHRRCYRPCRHPIRFPDGRVQQERYYWRNPKLASGTA